MDTVIKCAGLAVAGAILTLVVRKQSSEFAALVSLAVVLMISVLALQLLKPVLAFAQSLQDSAQLGEGVMAPVIKTLAIGFLTETGKNICEDAGEKTIGGVLQFAGGIAAFYVMLPLLQSVLDLLNQIL